MEVEFGSGKLIFPGTSQDLKPFKKDMRKLFADYATEMRQVHKYAGLSTMKWADVADEIVDTMIGAGPEATIELIFAMPYTSDNSQFVGAVLTIMERYGCAFYQQGGDGTMSPAEFHRRGREHSEVVHERTMREAE